MNGLFLWLTFLAALGCGLAAGVFFTFSTFVMEGLGRLPVAVGVAAMQSINITAVGFALMALLFGTALVCVISAVWAVLSFDGGTSALILAASALYLVGGIGVTIIFNVPLNDALASVEPGNAGALWREYLTNWVAWNHVRTITAVIATMLYMIAIYRA